MMIEKELSFLEENFFCHNNALSWEQIPARDEIFVETWEDYEKAARSAGAFTVLQERLVQFRFPVQKGLSANESYRLATLKGHNPSNMKEAAGTILKAPAEVSLHLYQTWAGRIPVIYTENRIDFETLVQVLAHKNEPVIIPPSMGACFVKGFNNWDRIKKHRRQWEPGVDGKADLELLWSQEFRKFKASPELYQDRFLILTNNEYSNVPAEMLGLTGDKWRQLSYLIRREHEAAHYFTLRFLGSAKNHLLDEFIADYMGLVAACGRYRADWFLCFMGLENPKTFRQGGRLMNYLTDKSISAAAFSLLGQYITNAAENVDRFSNKYAHKIYSAEGRYRMLLALSRLNLEILASDNAERALLENGLQEM